MATAASPDTPYDYLPVIPGPAEIIQLVVGGQGVSGDAGSILLAVLRDGDAAAREAALTGLAQASPRRLVAFDELLRDRWRWHAPHLARQVGQRLLDGDADDLLVSLAAAHPDGHVRQGAVAALADKSRPAALRMLLLRSTDWARPVREDARSVLGRRLPGAANAVIVDVAGFAATLAGRQQAGWLTYVINGAVAQAEPDLIAALVGSPERLVRRLAYRTGVDTDSLSSDSLVTGAVRDPDVLIRVSCARTLLAGTPSQEIIAALLQSRTAQVRAAALETNIARNGADTAHHMLLDRHPTVRSIAQQTLAAADIDLAALYRRHLVHDVTPAAVAGLGETGSAADAAVLTDALTAARPRVRVQAVRALRRLGAVDPERLKSLIRDESPVVVREVVQTLTGYLHIWAGPELEVLIGTGYPSHVRRAAYRLIRAKDVWSWLVTALRLISSDDEHLAPSARSDIYTWLQHEAARTYSRPSPDTAAQLAFLLPVLNAKEAAEMAFAAGLDI
ncbi:hypothetical protein [Pilimelia columellifera]|uniref:HEAT repeat domain-containing protein n=1 Tax=Pilimelia columellifera subsp. columellifera TaxID=706583 RepID=A0ABN3NSK8_9ACTN